MARFSASCHGEGLLTAAETPSAAPGATDLGRAPLEEVLAALRVDVQTGLSDAEVEARLRQYGANEVPEEKAHPLREFLKKFWGLSAWMIELIIGLSPFSSESARILLSSRALLDGQAVLSFPAGKSCIGGAVVHPSRSGYR